MAVRGSLAKAQVAKALARAFGEDWVGEYNGKYYVWAKDGAQRVQIAIALTCPKTLVGTVDSVAQGGDFDWSGSAGLTGATIAQPIINTTEITDEEKQNIERLKTEFNLDYKW